LAELVAIARYQRSCFCNLGQAYGVMPSNGLEAVSDAWHGRAFLCNFTAHRRRTMPAASAQAVQGLA